MLTVIQQTDKHIVSLPYRKADRQTDRQTSFLMCPSHDKMFLIYSFYHFCNFLSSYFKKKKLLVEIYPIFI